MPPKRSANGFFTNSARVWEVYLKATSWKSEYHSVQRLLNQTTDSLGRTGRFCFIVRASSPYAPFNLVLMARALNWQGTSLGLKDSGARLKPASAKFYHTFPKRPILLR